MKSADDQKLFGRGLRAIGTISAPELKKTSFALFIRVNVISKSGKIASTGAIASISMPIVQGKKSNESKHDKETKDKRKTIDGEIIDKDNDEI